MDELKPLLDLLPAKFGWVCTYLLMGQTVLKLVQPIITGRVQAAIDRVVSTNDTDDDKWLAALFSNKGYRAAGFILDLTVRIKLPGLAELNKAIEANSPTPPPAPVKTILPLLLVGLLFSTGCKSWRPHIWEPWTDNNQQKEAKL